MTVAAVAEAGTAEEYMQTAMETAVAAVAAAVTAVAAAAGSDGRKEGTDPPKKYIKKQKVLFSLIATPPLFKINSLLSVFFYNSPRREIHLL